MSRPELDYRKKALVHNENISVLAGAGSGKTHTLVQRYLEILLADPQNIRHLAAITFTRKAAGEMQERIFSAITKRLSAISDHVERLKLLQIRDQLKSAQISTIHEFCSKILHEYPLQAGLSPDFAVLEELQRMIILQEVLATLAEKITLIQSDSPRAGQWKSILARIGRKRLEDILRAMLTHPEVYEAFQSRFENMSLSEYLEFLWHLWLEKKEQIWPGLEPDILHTAVGAVIACGAPDLSKEKAQLAWQLLNEYHLVSADRTQPRQTWTKFLALIKKLSTNKGTPYADLSQLGGKAAWPGSSMEPMKNLSARCAEFYGAWLEKKGFDLPGTADEDYYHAVQIVLEIGTVLRHDYEQIKAREGLLDFDDLQIKTRDLLRQFPEVRLELRQRYRYLMVDEFQDTNKLQWEIVHLLSFEADEMNHDKKIFIVGDPKQSIYGFRNADVRVFREVRRRFEASGGNGYQGSVNFIENFRFLPELNAFINYVFSRLLIEVDGEPFTVGYEALRAMRTAPGFSRIAISVAVDETASEEILITRAIRKLIAEKTQISLPSDAQGNESSRPIEYGDVAVLIRSRTRLLNLEQALQKNGVPFKTIGGVGFWQRQEIFDLYHLLRFIQNPLDDLALIAVLRSRFFTVPDQELLLLSRVEGEHYFQKLINLPGVNLMSGMSAELAAAWTSVKKWLTWRDRLPLDELLSVVFEDTGIRAVLASEMNGEQLSANLLKIQELAATYTQKPGGGLAALLGQMQELIMNELGEGEPAVELEDRHTVKILTIHNSKGLQFPVVFVPYLTRDEKSKTESVQSDEDFGFTFQLKDGRGENSPNLYHDYVGRVRRAKELAEARRVLYVALTRAQNILWLTGDTSRKGTNKDQPLEWLGSALGLDENDFKNSQEKDYGEFVVGINPELPDLALVEADENWYESREHEILKALEKLPPAEEKVLIKSSEVQTFSPTRLMVYRNDRNEYFRRYHLGFFENDYDLIGQDVEKNEPVLLLGKLLHQLLEKPERMESERTAGYENLFARHDIHQPEARDYLKAQLDGLVISAHGSARLQKILRAAEYKTEVVLTMKLAGQFFTGTMDRLWQNESGQWQVIDYKTNRLRGVAAESKMAEYELQAQSYALLLAGLFPQQEKYTVQFAFIREDQWAERVYTAGDIARIRDEFSALIMQIVNEDWM